VIKSTIKAKYEWTIWHPESDRDHYSVMLFHSLWGRGNFAAHSMDECHLIILREEAKIEQRRLHEQGKPIQGDLSAIAAE
jgi:hypothetical protein